MTTDDRNAFDNPTRAWSPSSSAAQRMRQQAELGSVAIVDDSKPDDPLRALLGFFARPFVRIVIGLALFISAALAYDATMNYGTWTEKQERAKATKHQGVAGPKQVQKMPD